MNRLPKVCYVLHYLSNLQDEQVAKTNEQADMCVITPSIRDYPHDISIYNRLTCETWVYMSLNTVSGNPNAGGFAVALRQLAIDNNCILTDDVGEIVQVGPDTSPELVIDPRMLAVWPGLAVDLLKQYVADEVFQEKPWSGIFLDNGWRDFWPINHGTFSPENTAELVSWYPAFMQEAGVTLQRRMKMPIIGNGQWWIFVGKRAHKGKMWEGIIDGAYDSALLSYRELDGALTGCWSDGYRRVLHSGATAEDESLAAVAMLFDCWVSPRISGGIPPGVWYPRGWVPTGPAKKMTGNSWKRELWHQAQGRVDVVEVTFSLDYSRILSWSMPER